MNRRLAQLAERRNRLVAQAAAQRVALARDMDPWRPRLALADQALTIARYIACRPALMVGAAGLLLVVLRPRRSGKWLQRGWEAWRFGRWLRRH